MTNVDERELREISALRDYYVFRHNYKLFGYYNKKIAYRTREKRTA